MSPAGFRALRPDSISQVFERVCKAAGGCWG